jgi:hypothetical protein
MIFNKYSYKLPFLFLLMLFNAAVFSQNPVVNTFLNKEDILIGEQLEYKVVATYPTNVFKVRWLNVPDSMKHFELVEKSKIDTSEENGKTILSQILTLTSFDSGRWATPAFKINFDPVKDDTTINLFTDTLAVNVGYAKADSTNQLRDIKPIMDVTIKNYLWYYIAGGILLAALITFLLWQYFKNRKKQPALEFKGKLSPYDEAMQELEKLKTVNLQQPESTKQFHSKLGSIFKWYISRKQRFNVMNKTTGDILLHLADNKLPKDVIAQTAAALRTGDAVKFAKFLPEESESNDCLHKIKTVINFIHSPVTGASLPSTTNLQPQTTNNKPPTK